MIRNKGNYLAVKVPEYAFGFSLRTKDNKSIKRLYWCYDLPEEGYVEFKPLLSMDSEIIGLISEIEYTKDNPFNDVIDYFIQDTRHSEWNQWLIIKKV